MEGSLCYHSIISTRNYKPVGRLHYLTNLIFIKVYIYLPATVPLIYSTVHNVFSETQNSAPVITKIIYEVHVIIKK